MHSVQLQINQARSRLDEKKADVDSLEAEAQRAADAFGQSAASNREAAVQYTTASAPLTGVQAPSTAAANLGNVPAAAQSVAEPSMASTQQDPVGGEMIGCAAN